MSLEAAKLLGAKNVLFLTKKKAIGSIESDYKSMGYTYALTVINNESIHKINDKFDLIISDEHHRNGAFPKPNISTKLINQKFGNIPMIFLSGTPSPESYSQLYHQFWCSNFTPFAESNFYKWHKVYGIEGIKYTSYGTCNDYSKTNKSEIDKVISKYFISFTQKEAGFNTTVNENVCYVDIEPKTFALIKRLKRDRVIEGTSEIILADTGVKLMSKIHQLYSGTVKFESGNSKVIDYTKAHYIETKFRGSKIAIFYKFKEEFNAMKEVFGELLTDNLEEFNSTNKNIALQIVSGREGISLKEAKYLVYYNIDFSAVSYWQSRDRLTTMDRKENDVFWIFSLGGIEEKIYNTVLGKKDYTLSHFKKDERIGDTA